MEIRDPMYKPNDYVVNGQGIKGFVVRVENYNFDDNEYTYIVKTDETFIDEPAFISEDEYNLDPCQEPPKSVWDLKEWDKYYVISGYGEVLETTWKYNIDSNSRKIGNAFLTKEEAEFEVERRKVETEMLRLGGRRKFNRGKDNYFIMYTRIEGLDYVNYHSMHEQGVIYFDSELDAINAVKTIGKDRIEKYIFGVE